VQTDSSGHGAAAAPSIVEAWRKGRRTNMPYIIAWLLGVPALVLILIWLFMH